MIFLAWLRIARLPGCKVTPESGENTLECVLSAESAEDVRAVLDRALHHHRYRLDELEACIEFDPSAWNAESDPAGNVRAAAEAVREGGGVRFTSLGRMPEISALPRDTG